MFGVKVDELLEPKTAAKPAAKIRLEKIKPETRDLAEEYNSLAQALGLKARHGHAVKLVSFLRDNDYPTFHLGEVTKYMDEIAKRDNPRGSGWLWKPLRNTDAIPNTQFGNSERLALGPNRVVDCMSDYYHPGYSECQRPYDKVVPLAALRKVDAITKAISNQQVAFMVSDYSTRAGFDPDPFLLAVSREDTTQRFVIDFWDEPGFGLEQMLKSGLAK